MVIIPKFFCHKEGVLITYNYGFSLEISVFETHIYLCLTLLSLYYIDKKTLLDRSKSRKLKGKIKICSGINILVKFCNAIP
jgi:hypothetical protein